MALSTPQLQPRSRTPRDWGNWATVALLPNASGAALPANQFALEAGDTAFVTGGAQYVCLSPGTPGGADAIWISNSGTANPSPVLDADMSALALSIYDPIYYGPTAERRIDVTNAPASLVLHITKVTRALFPLVLDVSADPTYTTPAGLGQDYTLQSSSDQTALEYEVVIDLPSKTIRVVTEGHFDMMSSAPTPPPADTLDLSINGVFTSSALATAQGIPTTGAPFITTPGAGTRRIEDRGDGLGPMLLLEPSKTNLCLQSQTMTVAPWGVVPVGGTVAAVVPPGVSPIAGATVTDLTFALATDAWQQLGAIAAELTACFSVWARVSAGVGACRLRFTDKSGTVFVGPDEPLTTTWKRIWLAIPSTGRLGSTGTPAWGVQCRSAGGVNTVQVSLSQMETGQVWPSSFISTIAGTLTRASDTFYYPPFGSGPPTYPASFLTRGISAQVALDATSEEFFECGFNGIIVSIDNDRGVEVFPPPPADPYGPIADRDWLLFCGPIQELPAASGKARLIVFASTYFYGNVAAGGPATVSRSSKPFTWARGTLLTFAWEAYRGSLLVAGALTDNGRTDLGNGPWVYPGGTMCIAGITPGLIPACCIRMRPLLSAA